MTNLQFLSLLMPAIGSLVLVMLAWLNQNSRVTDLRGEMYRGLDQLGKQVGARFDAVDVRLDAIDRRLDHVDARLDKVEGHLSRIDQDLRSFHGTDKELEGRVNELSARINRA